MQVQRIYVPRNDPPAPLNLNKGVYTSVGLSPYFIAQIRTAGQNVGIIYQTRQQMARLLAELTERSRSMLSPIRR